MRKPDPKRFGWVLLIAVLSLPAVAAAADLAFPGGRLEFDESGDLASPVRLLLVLTVLSLAPSILVVLTAFTRIIIVLAMLRQALGMPETPPNAVLISLALFLTVFTMMPVWQAVNEQAVEPYLQNKLTDQQALTKALAPVRTFMVRQTREKDIGLILDLAHAPAPATVEELSTFHIIPAFMLSELRTAFEIGFILFLPFVLIDVIVASVLMSLGMIMVPPLAFSLPLKVLMFVLIDGWALLTAALVRSFVPI